jgi:lysophospholipase L1-like esterase
MPALAPLSALLISTTAAAAPTLFVAGDSTAAPYNAVDQQGWAEPFADYFDPAKIRIANRALGGRSSRTFITEGHWDKLLAEIRPGDFVLIQFGHNDAGALNVEPPGSKLPLRARGTIPGIGEETEAIDNVITKKHEVVHTFGWYVRKMIADVRARHAIPIVLTLTVRNEWQEGRIQCNGAGYRQWDRDIATAENVAFVDVTRIIADRYQQLGQTAVAKFFDKDTVHTNPVGADVNAQAVVAGLRALPGTPLSSMLSVRGKQAVTDFPTASSSCPSPQSAPALTSP